MPRSRWSPLLMPVFFSCQMQRTYHGRSNAVCQAFNHSNFCGFGLQQRDTICSGKIGNKYAVNAVHCGIKSLELSEIAAA